jgi:type 1 fimbriae regulatory protein FimB/type 1 fimbriae regulatory protein FimE
MILIGYRHGLRASELCDLQWSQIELATGRLHVRRAKNGSPSVHPMQGDEIRALRRLQREQGLSSHVFMTERDGPMTPKAFHALFGRIGARAKMQFPIHPHMLRHGCGYALANAGHDTRAIQAWMGHKNIQHTVCYTELAHGRGSGGIACRLEPIHQVEVGCDTHSRVPHWMYCSDFRGPPHMCCRPRLEGLEAPGS